MKARGRLQILALTFIGLLTVSSGARAQEPRFEMGTMLTSVMIGTGDDGVHSFGVPSSSFGIVNPAVYGSIFLGSTVSIEPQLGMIWASTNGDAIHLFPANSIIS